MLKPSNFDTSLDLLASSFVEEVQTKFNPKAVFESIAGFCNGRQYLQYEEQGKFIADMALFFKEKAYYDQEVEVPEEYQERFARIDLPMLLGAMGRIFKNASIKDVQRFQATIEKATSTHYTAIAKTNQVCQLTIKLSEDDGETLTDGWGWVHRGDLNRITVQTHTVRETPDPKALSRGYETAECVDVSDLTVKNYLACLTKLQNDKRGHLTPFKIHGPKSASSPYFNPDNPFESIARFTDRFSVLDFNEHAFLCQTIFKFFLQKAATNERLEIPPALIKRFSVVDLNFLIDHFPEETENGSFDWKKHRLIAAIQKVTNRRFIQIPEKDQLYQTHFQFGNGVHGTGTGWLQKSFIDYTAFMPPRPVKQEKDNYCIVGDSVELPGINPLLSSVLQHLQYSAEVAVELGLEVYLDAVLDLLHYAEEWMMEHLKMAIIGFLDYLTKSKLNEDEQILSSTIFARHLHQPYVKAVLKTVGITYIRPAINQLDEDELIRVLEYNLEQMPNDNKKDAFKKFAGDILGTDFYMFQVIRKFAIDKGNVDLIWGINSHIQEQFGELFAYESNFEDSRHVFTWELFKSIYTIDIDDETDLSDKKSKVVELVNNYDLNEFGTSYVAGKLSSKRLIEFFKLLDAEKFRLWIIEALPF